MPSIITHDTFGREVYAQKCNAIGGSNDEKYAFLLGSQGPDVLFYGSLNPLCKGANSFGKKLHRYNCTEFITALSIGVAVLADKKLNYSEHQIAIARAFVLGYLMHFELDSTVHPFVFSQTYSYCKAGISGLNMSSESEVHVEIECELDELVLSQKRGETISTFDPSTRILKGSNEVLNIISILIDFAINVAYSSKTPANMYRLSVKASRQVQRLIYSTSGIKREMFGRVELIFRKHSYVRAITHKNVFLKTSIFDNHEHEKWVCPWDNSVHIESFEDLYNKAFTKALQDIDTLSKNIDSMINDKDACDEVITAAQKISIYNATKQITNNLNFYGCDENIIIPSTGKPKGFR